MLAPSTITLRRPSGEADLILSRSETDRYPRCDLAPHPQSAHHSPSPVRSSRVQRQAAFVADTGSGGVSPRNCLSPLDGSAYHSAPVTASPSSNWTPSGSSSCIYASDREGSSLETSRPSTPLHGAQYKQPPGTPTAPGITGSNSSGSPLASPEARRRYWYRKLMKMKEDLDRVGNGFRRRASAGLRGGIDNLAWRLSPSIKRRSTSSMTSVDVLHGVGGLTVEIVRDTGAGTTTGSSGSSRSSRSSSCRRLRRRSEERTVSSDDMDYALGGDGTRGSFIGTAGKVQSSPSKGRTLSVTDHAVAPSAQSAGNAPLSSMWTTSASLQLTELRDGRFSAVVPLNWLPLLPGCSSAGSTGSSTEFDPGCTSDQRITVRIRDYRLEFFAALPPTQTASDGNDTSAGLPPGKGRISPSSPRSTRRRLAYCGAVSLPIYVDPGCLDFRLEPAGDSASGSTASSSSVVHRLRVEGWMKGCTVRRTNVADSASSLGSGPSCTVSSSSGGGLNPSSRATQSNRKTKPLSASASDVTLLAAGIPRNVSDDDQLISRGVDASAATHMKSLSIRSFEATSVA